MGHGCNANHLSGKEKKGEQVREIVSAWQHSEIQLKSSVSVLRLEKLGIICLEMKNNVPKLTLLNHSVIKH